MACWVWTALFIFIFFVLSYHRASLSVWTIALGTYLILKTFLSHTGTIPLIIEWGLYLIIFTFLNFKVLRELISRHIFLIYKKSLPEMSKTESEALNAGTTGWTSDLFSGAPDWQKFTALPFAKLSAEEQAFLDGPVEELCTKLDDWDISRRMVIPDEIMDFLKKNGFFGLIIPKAYGGKEFSATAHSQIIMKVAGVCIAAAVTISVPNSLGPAELLLHYGTEEQKKYYLPRLASGQEIPSFALTSPRAGSDASAIVDYGVVFEGEFEGKKQICIRLNWNKRYITLAPIATLLGLAFKLYDPQHLLGQNEELGITCALIPTHVPGIVIGNRHYPLDSAFQNGPTQGHDVIIPIDWLIGGAKMAGKGWVMLMECLAAGRSISLPSLVTGGSLRGALAAGAYSRIRRQFNTYIGNFGGVEESLARIGTHSYIVEATRLFTMSALDQQQKPAVDSAIIKYHTTDMSRSILNDVMDIHGGKAICMGPHNYLALGYIEAPISITVEGANILTRSMIIFGQGVIRCHPYILKEMKAVQNSNAENGLKEFDSVFFSHLGFVLSNMVRSLLLGITNGRLSRSVPHGVLQHYYQQFTRFSSVLALVADFCMFAMGGALKRKEKISGRLADLLSYLYLGSSVLKYYDAEKNPEELCVVQWSCQELLYKLQTRLDQLLNNLPTILRWFLRIFTLPLGRRLKYPHDRLGKKVATLLLEPSSLRKRFAKNIYYAPNPNNLIGKMENILQEAIAVEPIEKKLYQAQRKKIIQGKTIEELIQAAITHGVLTTEEAQKLLSFDKNRMLVINVDDFPPDSFYFRPQK